ncbi:MAG: branched-chain amino acid ABC transporter permease [Roseinatronobacter sp.]|uniref:Amino acid/amide ABC transporter membrane protein 1 (HAAT family) n=1 Tax=Roseinatronobacter monicus TaxID=393481 RepID=A0A543KH56_9RHOB|nr:branched-chain amino acid ABC transporter permease [Roseinatronobacter monicus]TQM94410.1 amino acid/amide ABC transporter membrane protein 1 (HAAT family) [Roseinatronobacter monicus]TVP99180.1 MAG: branched-chain amino acid ABC transporter permease [Roseinatronobacter sp.]
MSLQFILTVTLNGLTLASLYFIVACGFSLIFGLMRTVNMAHGSLYMVGAYVGFAVYDPLYASSAWASQAWLIGIVAGIGAAALVGLIMQVAFLGWMQGQELRQALVTIGLSIIIADQILATFGGNPFRFFAPDMLFGPVEVPIIGRYPVFRLFQVILAIAVGVGLWLLLNKTKLGIIVRAGVDDRQMLAACGINVPLVAATVFALGAGLAGLGGVIGATAQPMSLGVDVRFLLMSLVVVIVGGMGSIGGTALGALLIGLAEQWGQVLFPTYSVILTFVIMATVLAVWPQGLLGRKPT